MIFITWFCLPLTALAFMHDWGRGITTPIPIKDVEMDGMTSEKENTYDAYRVFVRYNSYIFRETAANLKDMVLSRYYLTLFFVYIMWYVIVSIIYISSSILFRDGPASQLTKDWGKLCESMRLDGLAVNLYCDTPKKSIPCPVAARTNALRIQALHPLYRYKKPAANLPSASPYKIQL